MPTIIRLRENGPIVVEGDDVVVIDWNGPVPVVITHSITYFLDANLSITAELTYEYKQVSSLRAGIEYNGSLRHVGVAGRIEMGTNAPGIVRVVSQKIVARLAVDMPRGFVEKLPHPAGSNE